MLRSDYFFIILLIVCWLTTSVCSRGKSVTSIGGKCMGSGSGVGMGKLTTSQDTEKIKYKWKYSFDGEIEFVSALGDLEYIAVVTKKKSRM
jgi:hypothetical protein